VEFFTKGLHVSFMKRSRSAMLLSISLIIISYVLLFSRGLNFGIDFAGGTIVQVKYENVAPIDTIRQQLGKNVLFKGASITEFGSPQEIIIRLKNSSEDVTNDLGDVTREALQGSGNFEIRRVDIVGPKVGNELQEKGIMSLLLATIGILIYVAFRFEWRFAVASIAALIHDISITLGALALFQIDVNLDVLAALLTILGYSLNDTIIVFDRIREGIIGSKSTELLNVIDESVSKTLSRTTLTSLTTFFVVLTLFVFGGEIIHSFAFTLLVGIIVGTYSSIFVASPILKWLGFSISSYRERLAQKAKREAEKERMRSQFEQGSI